MFLFFFVYVPCTLHVFTLIIFEQKKMLHTRLSYPNSTLTHHAKTNSFLLIYENILNFSKEFNLILFFLVFFLSMHKHFMGTVVLYRLKEYKVGIVLGFFSSCIQFSFSQTDTNLF